MWGYLKAVVRAPCDYIHCLCGILQNFTNSGLSQNVCVLGCCPTWCRPVRTRAAPVRLGNMNTIFRKSLHGSSCQIWGPYGWTRDPWKNFAFTWMPCIYQVDNCDVRNLINPCKFDKWRTEYMGRSSLYTRNGIFHLVFRVPHGPVWHPDGMTKLK